jgi:HEAT repeat protein
MRIMSAAGLPPITAMPNTTTSSAALSKFVLIAIVLPGVATASAAQQPGPTTRPPAAGKPEPLPPYAASQLANADPEVRLAGVKFLAFLPNAAAFLATLHELERSDPDPGVRKAAREYVAVVWNSAKLTSPYLERERLPRAEVVIADIAATITDPNVDPAVRADAAERVPDYGRVAPRAYDALAKAMKDPDADVRVAAAYTLARIGPPAARAATEALGTAIQDPDARVRDNAARALMHVTGNRTAVPALAGPAAAALADERPDVRLQAVARVDVRGDAAVAAKVGELATGDPERRIRLAAIRRLADAGRGADVVLRAMADEDAGVRDEAERALDNYAGTAGLAALADVLAPQLDNADAGVRLAAAKRLAAVRGLPPARVGAARTRAGQVIAEAIAAVPDGHPVPDDLRTAASRLQPEIGPALADADRSGLPDARARAASVAGGDAASLARLHALLADPEPRVQYAAVARLRQLVGPPGLLKVLDDPRPAARAAAASELASVMRLESDASDAEVRAALAVAARAIENTDPSVRAFAASLLEQCRSADATPLVLRAAADADRDVRALAALALHAPARVSRPAFEALARLAADPDARVREFAVRGLGRPWRLVGTPGQLAEVIPLVVRAIDDPSPEVRSQALLTLGELGAEARSAVPAIRRLARDKVLTEEAARRVLARVDRENPSLSGQQVEDLLAPDPTTGLVERLGRDPSARSPGQIEKILSQDPARAVREYVNREELSARALAPALAAALARPDPGRAAALPLSLICDVESRVPGLRHVARPPQGVFDAVRGGDAAARRAALGQLAAAGESAKETSEPFMSAMRDDPDPGVRETARAAIKSLWVDPYTGHD